MSNAQSVFPYLLITQHPQVGMSVTTLSIGGIYQHDGGQLYSFLSTKPFDDVNMELGKVGIEYALVLSEKFGYAHASGGLAGVFDHIT